MDTTYEIFKKFPEGPIWVECAAATKIAERLEKLNETSPGEYFAYDVREARIVAEFSGESKLDDDDGNCLEEINGR